MSIRLYADEFRCAIYEEAPGGGEADNPNAPMNRPVLAPLSWLPNIYFHSDLDYYPVAAHGSVGIAHSTVAGQTVRVGTDSYVTTLYYGRQVVFDHLLLQHNLGYPPRFFAAYDGKMMPHGMPVHAASGGVRLVCAYATPTQIRMREFASSSASDLPAVSRNYQTMAFRNSGPIPELPMLDIQPGIAIFGQGRFQGTQPHLRATGAGDTVFAQARSRTAAVRNGAFRAYPPNGSPVDLGGFTGTLPAPTFYNVTAGV